MTETEKDAEIARTSMNWMEYLSAWASQYCLSTLIKPNDMNPLIWITGQAVYGYHARVGMMVRLHMGSGESTEDHDDLD